MTSFKSYLAFPQGCSMAVYGWGHAYHYTLRASCQSVGEEIVQERESSKGVQPTEKQEYEKPK